MRFGETFLDPSYGDIAKEYKAKNLPDVTKRVFFNGGLAIAIKQKGENIVISETFDKQDFLNDFELIKEPEDVGFELDNTEPVEDREGEAS